MTFCLTYGMSLIIVYVLKGTNEGNNNIYFLNFLIMTSVDMQPVEIPSTQKAPISQEVAESTANRKTLLQNICDWKSITVSQISQVYDIETWAVKRIDDSDWLITVTPEIQKILCEPDTDVASNVSWILQCPLIEGLDTRKRFIQWEEPQHCPVKRPSILDNIKNTLKK